MKVVRSILKLNHTVIQLGYAMLEDDSVSGRITKKIVMTFAV